MRITIVAIALLLAGPAYAEEFKPPPIQVSGKWGPNVTKESVTDAYVASKPGCVKRAVDVARTDSESDAQYLRRQNTAYVFCMAEEMAANGLSVKELVDKITEKNS